MPQEILACAVCHKSVKLETAKTNERGEPVHEECYVQATLHWEGQSNRATLRPTGVNTSKNHPSPPNLSVS